MGLFLYVNPKELFMPIYNSPLDMLAAFVIVYAISALSTMALAWFIKRTARKAARRFPLPA